MKRDPFDHPLLSVWTNILMRCYVPSTPAFVHYGRRGIRVAQRWRRFENFVADMGSRPSAKHSIDRIDVNGPYAPENCRWATTGEQALNKRTNRLLTHGGETLPVTTWAAKTGIGRPTIFSRLRHGWTVEQTLSTPAVLGQRVRVRSIAKMARERELPVSTVHWRLKEGWNLEDALKTPAHQGPRVAYGSRKKAGDQPKSFGPKAD